MKSIDVSGLRIFHQDLCTRTIPWKHKRILAFFGMKTPEECFHMLQPTIKTILLTFQPNKKHNIDHTTRFNHIYSNIVDSEEKQTIQTVL